MSKMPWVRFSPSDWLAGTRGMSAAETGIYITLIATMYDRAAPLIEDHGRLARLCGASNVTFRNALEALIEAGKIIRTESGLWNDRVAKEQVYLAEKSEVGLHAARARWDKKSNEINGTPMRTQYERNANKNIDNKNIDSPSLRSGETRASPSGFDAFWAKYPNKVGKRDAQASFDRALKRADPQAIMDGLDAYVSKTDDRPWCNPATWLNQDRWNDRPAQVQAQAKQKPLSAFDQHQADVRAALEKSIRKNHDEEFTGQAFDLGPADWRPH